LCSWCEAEGVERDVESILDPDTVDRFVRLAGRGVPDTTVARWRYDLRIIGPTLTRRAPWEPRTKPLARAKVPPPYNDHEVREICRDAAHQATPLRTRSARAIVALGFGAGLDARWSCKIRGIDVLEERRGVVIRVPDPRPREVVVRRRFEHELLALADVAEEAPLVGLRGRDRSLPSRIANETIISQGRIHLDAIRLRSTWLVAQLNASTNIRVLIEAAGLGLIQSLRDLYPDIAPVRPHDAAEQLRWA
jgi:hypothetical protein